MWNDYLGETVCEIACDLIMLFVDVPRDSCECHVTDKNTNEATSPFIRADSLDTPQSRVVHLPYLRTDLLTRGAR